MNSLETLQAKLDNIGKQYASALEAEQQARAEQRAKRAAIDADLQTIKVYAETQVSRAIATGTANSACAAYLLSVSDDPVNLLARQFFRAISDPIYGYRDGFKLHGQTFENLAEMNAYLHSFFGAGRDVEDPLAPGLNLNDFALLRIIRGHLDGEKEGFAARFAVEMNTDMPPLLPKTQEGLDVALRYGLTTF
jgi:hypothetical protein